MAAGDRCHQSIRLSVTAEREAQTPSVVVFGFLEPYTHLEGYQIGAQESQPSQEWPCIIPCGVAQDLRKTTFLTILRNRANLPIPGLGASLYEECLTACSYLSSCSYCFYMGIEPRASDIMRKCSTTEHPRPYYFSCHLFP
jgi:hypothetical protein